MLVTLGSNVSIGAGASQTFQYACNSAQKIYVRCADAGEALDGHLTVQIGNDVVVNDINFDALSLISLVNGGGQATSTNAHFCVDIGSHILEPLENLYVTIRNSDSANAMSATDVSAIVNEGGVYSPLKWTNYSDTVFTDSNTLSIYATGTNSLENDTSAFTIRNQAYSATPQIQSGVNISLSQVQGELASATRISVLAQNQVPMDTSVNYTSASLNSVVCISAMPKFPSKASASKKAGQAVLSSMSSSERKAL